MNLITSKLAQFLKQCFPTTTRRNDTTVMFLASFLFFFLKKKQAISLLAEAGKAKLIEFNPIRAKDVPLPATVSFVVANSLAVSNKADTASKNYNVRVVECRLAAMLLGKALEMSDEELLEVRTLQDIETKFLDDLGKAAEFAKTTLSKPVYSKAEIEEILKIPLDKIFNDLPAALQVIRFMNKPEIFVKRLRCVMSK